MSAVVWKYIGGDRAVPGVPAKDLTEADLEHISDMRNMKRDYLEKEISESKLYVKESKSKKADAAEVPVAIK